MGAWLAGGAGLTFAGMRLVLRLFCLLLPCVLAVSTALAQDRVILEGYVYEDNNRGFLNDVTVTVLDAESSLLYGEAVTNIDGFFAMEVPTERDFLVRAKKAAFLPAEGAATTKDMTLEKAFVKIPMGRAPGYRLEVTLAEERLEGQEEVNAIEGSLIEVYNITTDEEILTLKNHPSPYFSFQLEQGNHYTLLIRSPGYFTKRIESYINIDGCILCMDGVSEIGPGVSDNLSYGNDVGTLLANIELKPLRIDSAIALNNIYYDYNRATIRPDAQFELDKVVELLRVNPSIVVELGSHTDSRGDQKYNQRLSQERAQSAVDYITSKGIDERRLSARGYGESKLLNRCSSFVECSDDEHARNRRTELRITGFTNDPFEGKPLAEIIAEEQIDALLEEVLASSEVRIPEDGGAASAAVDASLASLAAGEDGAKVTAPDLDEAARASRAGDSAPRRSGTVRRFARVNKGGNAATAKKAAAKKAAPTADAPTASIPSAGGDVTAGGSVTATATNSATGPIKVIVPEQSLTNVKPLTMPTGAKFSGYRVLVFQSPVTLADDNGELFYKFGTLKEDQLADGTFGYMSGAFLEEAEARSYLSNVSTLFPAARLLRYVNGYIVENAK